MKTYIIYVLSSGLALGILWQTFFSVPFVILYGIAFLVLGIAVFSGQSNTLRLLVVCCLAVVLGVLRMDIAQQQLQHSAMYDVVGETTVSGTVVTEPEARQRSLHVQLQLAETRLLVIADRNEVVAFGDVVEVTGRLQTPAPFAAELGRVFPYDGYLAARGVTHLMFYPEVVVQSTGAGNPLIAGLLTFKSVFMERIEAFIPEPQVGLSEGLLLGVRRAMQEETLAHFRTTGIIHIVVLSGFNVMLVVSFVQYILGFILPLRSRIVVALLAIVSFAIIVGLTATVVRASIMATMLLVAQYLGRTYEAIRGLFLAGAAMIVINPYLLVYDIGFQLSFVATFGLILIAPHLERMFTLAPLKVSGREYVVATVATQIAVMPLLLYHVGEFSIVSPIVNLAVLPLVPVAMFCTFATGLLAFVTPTLASLLAICSYLALEYILVVAQWFATLPYAAIWVPAFPFWLVPVSYALMGWSYWWYVSHRREVPSTPVPVAHPEEVSVDLSDWMIVDTTPENYRPLDTKSKTARPVKYGRAETKQESPVFFR